MDSRLASLEIVHIVRQYAPRIGGLESFVAKLAAEQRKTYRRVRVVTCDRIFTDPETVLLEQFDVTLTLGPHSRVVTLHGISGRVTVQ